MALYKFVLQSLLCTAINAATESLMKVKYSWVNVDYQFNDSQHRETAIESRTFVPENCAIFDVDVCQCSSPERLFVTVPRLKTGNPSSLNELVPGNEGDSPLLTPYPNWEANTVLDDQVNCDDTIISVFRTKIDDLCRFWVVDAGTLDLFTPTAQSLCPPKLLIYDLKNGDSRIKLYKFPSTQVKDSSVFTNIVVDMKDNDGQNIFAYISDTAAYKLIVYDYKNDDSWVINQANFYPYPTHSNYIVNGVKFTSMDGVLGLALGPVLKNDRMLYFHSFASFRESWVSCSVLQNKSMFQNGLVDGTGIFFVSPEARKIQSNVEVMTNDGILISTSYDNSLVSWDSKKEFISKNLHCVYRNDEEFQFSTGLKIVGDEIWATSNQMIINQSELLDRNAVKYRVLVGKIDKLINSKVCDTELINTIV